MSVNPFSDVIVYEPRRIEKSVPGLNEKPLRAILSEFEKLADNQLPGHSRKLSEAVFLTSPEPGYGKSHLIGRLFRELAGRATLIYIRPFVDPDGGWQSVLRQMIQEMDFPDRTELDYCDENEPRQLESFSHGVLAHLVADLIAARRIPHDNIETAVRFLRENPRQAFDLSHSDSTWAAWMKENAALLHPQLCQQLWRRAIMLTSASASSWLNLLFHLAFRQNDLVLRDACRDWLCARSIAPVHAEQIGIAPADQPQLETSQGTCEQLASQRLLDLCQLAAFFRPNVFCFDQTENYGTSVTLVEKWSVILESMVSNAPNCMVLLTANLRPWQKNLRPYFQDAHLHRLRDPAIQLEGLTKEQARELVAHRLEGWPLNGRSKPLNDGNWIDGIFVNHTQIGAREFLRRARENWDTLPATETSPAKTLEDIYKEYVVAIQTKPRRLQFDPDFFKWLVRDAAAKIPELAIEPCEPSQRYFPIRWKWAGQVYLFGFEGGSNWKRWEAIMRNSDRECRGNPKSPTTSVLFRTAELAPIPGKNWGIAGALRQAINEHMRVVQLTEKRIAEMYACKDMHSDAIQGDLNRSPDEVLVFTAEKLTEWWTRLTANRTERIQPESENVSQPETDLTPRLRTLMQKEKFLSLTEVLATLGPPCTEENVFKAKGYIPELKIFPSDQMTVLLWQSST